MRRLGIAALAAGSLGLLAWRGGILYLEHAPVDRATPSAPSCVGTLDAAEDRAVARARALDVSSKWAGGGMLASAEDLARFGTAHLIPFNRGFLADATLATLFTPLSRPAPFMGYGLGWIVGRDHRGRRVRMHFGAGSGGTAVLVVFPGRQVVIALVANLGHAGFPGDRLLAIAQPFVGDPWGWLVWMMGIAGLAGALALVRRRHRPPL